MTEPAPDLELAAPQPTTPARRAMPTVRFGWLRSILGLRRSFTIGGVKYKELTAEPLSRALSRRGSRAKDYNVSFPGGRRMRITVTPTRAYEDLNGPALLDDYRLAAPFLRPGMRIVALRSGSGYAAAWLAGMVGPSGAVVALDPDNEVIRYARWRYRLANVSFEVGDHTALAGEIDGAFDAALAIRALREEDDVGGIFTELWRTLAPGGSLIAVTATLPGDPGDSTRPMSADDLAAALIAPAAREATAHRSAQNEAGAHPTMKPAEATPPPPPPNPEVRVLPSPHSLAAVAIRKTPASAA